MGAIGHIFIFMLIVRRGPLFTTLVTTTRKVFTVLLSVYSSNASLHSNEATGICIVIAGLLLEGLSSLHTKKDSGAKAAAPETLGTAPRVPGLSSAASDSAGPGRLPGDKKHK